MSTLDFSLAARAIGIHQGLYFVILPDRFATALLDCAKRHARFLEKAAPQLKHTQALEFIARAAGHPNWHTMQTLITKLQLDGKQPATGASPRLAEERFTPFISSLPLLISVPPNKAPLPEQLTGLQALAQAISVHAALELGNTRNMLATMNGADSWETLLVRQNTYDNSPLYVFQIDRDGQTGSFRWSDRCDRLVEEQDELFQQYEDRTTEEQLKCKQHVLATVEAYPSFLEGHLALATILEFDEEYAQSESVLEQAMVQADELIPTNFTGQMPFNDVENRFYHRILYKLIEAKANSGHPGTALVLANRMLRLDDHDPCGIRFVIAALLCATGETSKSMHMLEPMAARRTNGQTLLLLSMTKLEADDVVPGIKYFLRALFETPLLRIMIERAEINSTIYQASTRMITPDIDQTCFCYDVICARHPFLDAAFKRILGMALVQRAEVAISAGFHKAGGRRGDVSAWYQNIENTIESIAPAVISDLLRSSSR